jgi:hypothetical protein
MATRPLDQKKDARYHAIAATEKWAAFVQATQAELVRTIDQRKREVAERKRETTYARGELGRH